MPEREDAMTQRDYHREDIHLPSQTKNFAFLRPRV